MKQIKIQLQNKGKNAGYFELKNKDEKAELLIYGDISSDKWNSNDVTPKEIKDLLDEANGKELDIYINSSGGNVFAGIAIYNMLKRYSGVKTVYVDGLAASAASFIAMAGDTIIVPKNAYLMIHRAMTIAFGNINDMHSAIELLEKTDSTIADIIGAFATCWFGGIMTATDLEYGLQYMFVEWFVWCGIIKSLFFAFIIASVSSFFGYTVEGGSIEVGKASTDSVVSSSVLILFADLVLTKLLMG